MADIGRVEEGCQHPSQTRPQSRSQSEADTPRHHAVVDVKASPFAVNAQQRVRGPVCVSLLALLRWLFNLDHVVDAQNCDGSLGGERDGLALAHGWLDDACREAVVDGARPAPDFSCQIRVACAQRRQWNGKERGKGRGRGRGQDA